MKYSTQGAGRDGPPPISSLKEEPDLR